MLHLCPTCRRRFDEAGFCPFDGTALFPSAAAEQQMQVSAAMAAQVPGPADRPPAGPPAPPSDEASRGPATGPATEIDLRRSTFPLTPSPRAAAGTGEITQSRQPRPPPQPSQPRPRPGPAPAPGVRAPSDPPRVQAQSASEDPRAALELLRAPPGGEYDGLIGQTLDGRYHVEARIGEGGMGVVFSARHAVIERPLAIKVLKREAMRDAATIRRFVQEAKAASRIGHPNIVDVTDFGTTPDGMTYSVMERVPGQTLGAALRAGAPFPEARALRITAQIARALAAAHDKGIVHRDLKPENVFLLDRDGRPDFVKIVDFGIAKVSPPRGKTTEPRLTRAGSVFGTPEYMAPEQAAGRGDTDGRVDVYALGVILYEMICGRVPHRGESMVRTIAMQMLDPIEPPSKVRPDLPISRELEAVVMHALVKKRAQRYQTMGELLAALDAILPPPVGQSVTGSPVYTLTPLPPGADPGVVTSAPAMPLPPRPGVEPAPTPGVEPARSSSPTVRRAKDEPEFTADDRPPSFQHVFTEEIVPARRRRRPVLLALMAGGAVAAVAVAVTTRRPVAERARDAGIVALPGDAGPPEPPGPGRPRDAAVDPDADAIVLPEPDAGRRRAAPPRRDAAAEVVPDTPTHRGTIVVQVLTRPEGAGLYDGFHYRGPGGTQLEEPLGTRLAITCRQPGYQPGTVEVTFDGRTDAVLCVLTRIKRCVDGLKNPFDDCGPP